MKKIIYTLAICFGAISACSGQSSPEYTGPLDNTVNVPAVRFGKQYNLKGSRIGGGGSFDTTYVNNLISAAIDSALNAYTDTAIVTVVGNIGTVEPVLSTDSYGIVRWTNTTGAPAGEGLHIKVTYSTPYHEFAVPVVAPYVTTAQTISLSVAAPVLPSFDVELGEDIPAGESVGFTYIVKGK